MEVVVCKSYEELSRKAARSVADIVEANPEAVLGMASGSSPLGLYRELIRMHREESLDFSRVTTFNLDEYLGLPDTHEQSYHYFMRENFFKHVNVPQSNIHIPSGTTDDPQTHACLYEELIEQCGGIDVQILGIGTDGHMAFNEPASSLASRTRLKTLAKETIEDNSRFFDKIEDVPVHAITMGVGTILEARKLVLVADGERKADAMAAAIEGPVTSMITTSAIQLHPAVEIYLDEAAASKLKMREYYDWVQANKPDTDG